SGLSRQPDGCDRLGFGPRDARDLRSIFWRLDGLGATICSRQCPRRSTQMREGKNLVGVDIGSSSVKVCQLKEGRRGLGLAKFGFVPLRPQTIVDGQVMDAGSVVEALSRAFHDNKIRQKEVALSVSGQSVIIRKITVPMMTAAELYEQIHWEAEQHIPFDIKDVQVDYQVLRRRPE